MSFVGKVHGGWLFLCFYCFFFSQHGRIIDILESVTLRQHLGTKLSRKKFMLIFPQTKNISSLRCWCWYVNSSYTRWVLSNESQNEIKLCMKLYELSDSCGLFSIIDHHSLPNNILVPSLVSQKRNHEILSEYFMCLSFVCDTCNLKITCNNRAFLCTLWPYTIISMIMISVFLDIKRKTLELIFEKMSSSTRGTRVTIGDDILKYLELKY